jgi:hypothetical protein
MAHSSALAGGWQPRGGQVASGCHAFGFGRPLIVTPIRRAVFKTEAGLRPVLLTMAFKSNFIAISKNSRSSASDRPGFSFGAIRFSPRAHSIAAGGVGQ